MSEQDASQEWPLRPWLIAGLLGTAGLLIHLLGGGDGFDTRDPSRAALTALLFFGPIILAFTIERDRWKQPLLFAVVAGLILAGLAWRAVSSGGDQAGSEYAFFAGLLATGLAVPLFQVDFHRDRFRISYTVLHRHVWNDAICAAGSLAFVGASWLMLLLLGELFHLLKIDFLRDLLDDSWFGWTCSGAAFGAALGVLRNEAAIIGTLRRVVMTVLSLLAVPLAAGLALFLVAMLISGPAVLWEATRSATPVLLSCAAVAWVLANAILRDDDAAMSDNRILRVAGLVLVLSILPLTLFAAVSMGTRIAQHGLSPERLWGLVAIAVAVAYGLAWLVAVLRGLRTQAWRERVRRANLHLAVVICALALFLALPFLDFGAISARQQIARLERGGVSATQFDYEALRWDFGTAGRRALTTLARSSDPVIARLAREALERTVRIYPTGPQEDYTLQVRPADPALERMVRNYLRSNPWTCVDYCVALDLGPAPQGKRRVVILTGAGYAETTLPFDPAAPQVAPPAPASPSVNPRSRIELRTIERRQIYVDGKPFGRPLEEAPLEGRPRPR